MSAIGLRLLGLIVAYVLQTALLNAALLAVAIGQQLNPMMYPPDQLYEYRHKETPKYNPSIRLGP
jgi:SMODS-associated and fused to various effectors sensor domain